MKKGLRHIEVIKWFRQSQNRRPDEEGIKTAAAVNSMSGSVRTVDLMKKGLRPSFWAIPLSICGQNRRPDEEGIKTVVAGFSAATPSEP